MRTNLAAAEAEFRQWVTEGMEEGTHDAATLLALPAEEREPWMQQHPEALRYHTFVDLIQGVTRAIGRDPLEAVALSDLIVRHVDRVPVPSDAGVVHILLRINAWRERGNALRNIGEYAAAGEAFHTGLALAESSPALIVEVAIMKRGVGLILHHQKDHEGALRALREGVPIFRAVHDRLQLLRTRLIEGYIEYGTDDGIALEIFEETLELSRELGDADTEARSHANAAHCARRLGFRERATVHFTAAAEHLQRCGLTAETIRAEWGLTLMEAGDNPSAILPALDRIRDRFLATGRKADAAWVSLDVVILLGDDGRHDDAARLAISLVETFATLGLPAEALRALAELRDAASQGTMTTALLEDIQERLQKL
jgi:tetratricopeptide (TPR) repeat protein